MLPRSTSLKSEAHRIKKSGNFHVYGVVLLKHPGLINVEERREYFMSLILLFLIV